MAKALNYERQKDGMRMDFRGVNTVLPPDQMPAGKFPFAQNVRRYLQAATVGRAVENSSLFALAAAAVTSMRRLNDTTPAGPPAGFIIVSQAGADLYAAGVVVNSTLSGQRVSLVPFRPNASVQPWMYVADEDVMLKVRSDGTTYKDGIKEPQNPATGRLSTFPQDALINGFEVVSQWTPINATLTEGVRSPATAITAIVFDFGTTGNASVVWPGTTTPNSTLFLNDDLSDAVFVASVLAAPGNTTIASIVYDSGTTGNAWITLGSALGVLAGQVYLLNFGGGNQEYVQILNIQDNAGQTLIYVFTMHTHVAGETMTGEASYRMNFPIGAVAGDTLEDSYVELTVTGAGTPVTLEGDVTTNFYQHIHSYAGTVDLRNPVDGGPSSTPPYGNPGAGSYPLEATGTGNSVLFNPPALAGEDPNVQPIQQATLDPSGNIIGYTVPWSGATQNYNMIVLLTLVFPAAGNYTIEIDHDDGMFFGASPGVNYVSGPQVGPPGQIAPTLTALDGLPVIGGTDVSGYNKDTFVVEVTAAGSYAFEIDYVQWENEQCLNLYVDGVTPSPGTSTPEYGMYTFQPAVDQLLGTRPVQLSDQIHLIMQTNLPASIEDITITFNIDPTAQDFITNALVWTIPGSQITAANTWLDLVITVQALVRIGQGEVSGATVTAGGSGYSQSTTTVAFVGGGGTGAAGTAIVDPSSAAVTGIVITNPGSGYSSAPTISIMSGIGGVGAEAVAGLAGLNLGLSLSTGIYGVQIVVTKSSGSVEIQFANLVIVGQYGPTVLADELSDVWYYTYFSTATGAESNPSPVMRAGLAPSAQAAVLQGTPSTDPQVNLLNWYRQGGAITFPVFVGNSPNSTEPFLDDFDDTTVENNIELNFENFEPFPSIDLPKIGVVSTDGFTVNWVSGDIFNIRWLPGTIILIHGIAYDLYNRPQSTTSLQILQSAGLQTNVPYQIQEPSLAAQPMRAMWGPTDNVAYMFACQDPIRPGTLYFTAGNNPDAAPDTNQMEVTSPSEPLMNGCIVNGLSLVFSTEHAWFAYPNFFDALATVTGIEGSPFTMVLSISNRGLFAVNGLATDGGNNAFFIGKDGIYVSPGGQGSQSITDADLFNLFPHEISPGVFSVPENVTLAGFTIYAPDFTNPNAMALSFNNGYLYFDYQDFTGVPRTLTFDVAAGGWVPDFYQYPATSHVQQEGQAEGTLVGCMDGSIRELVTDGIEVANAVLLLPAFNAGDTRAQKRFGDIYLEAQVAEGFDVTVTPYTNLFLNPVAGSAPTALVSEDGERAPYIVDFENGQGLYARDLEAALSWVLNDETIVFVWQPSLVPQPEGTQNRPSDWDDGGTPGAKFVQGLMLEADTFGDQKTFQVQSADDMMLHVPNEVPVTFDGQSILPFTFTPPFIAHSMRIVTTDSVEWRTWSAQWVFQPYPELVSQWQTEMVSHGVKGWMHLREMNIPAIAIADLQLTLAFDWWPTIVLTVPSTSGLFKKQKVTLPANKSKLVSYRVNSLQPFRLFEKDVEVKIKEWGSTEAYKVLKPFGGPSNAGALV
jgi:hypothetical protein